MNANVKFSYRINVIRLLITDPTQNYGRLDTSLYHNMLFYNFTPDMQVITIQVFQLLTQPRDIRNFTCDASIKLGRYKADNIEIFKIFGLNATMSRSLM